MAPLLLAAVLALPASAARLPDCIHLSSTSVRMQKSLDAVRAAQARGAQVPAAKLDALDDHHRAEVRKYLAQSGEVIEGDSIRVDESAGKNAAAGEKLAAHARPGQLGGLTAAALAKVSPGDAAALQSLQKRLHAAAGDGSSGVTPGMARDMMDTIMARQGFVSGDMKALLEAVVKDGGKLTPETMKLLQNAGRAAKGAGLPLNIDPAMEKPLLEHDFDQDKDAPQAPPASPGSL
jgi:hypothetical protein